MNILDLLFPPRCVLCGRGIDHGLICSDCVQALHRDESMPIRLSVPGFDDAYAAVRYHGRVRGALVRCKYGHGIAIVRWGGGMTAACLLQCQSAWKVDLVTYVPTTLAHWWKRGFNLSKQLARYTACRCALPYCRTLRRAWFGASQLKQKGRVARMENAQRTYSPGNRMNLAGHRVVLIDDVMTTGATAMVCAAALRQMGAQAVYLVCLATTGTGGKK